MQRMVDMYIKASIILLGDQSSSLGEAVPLVKHVPGGGVGGGGGGADASLMTARAMAASPLAAPAAETVVGTIPTVTELSVGEAPSINRRGGSDIAGRPRSNSQLRSALPKLSLPPLGALPGALSKRAHTEKRPIRDHRRSGSLGDTHSITKGPLTLPSLPSMDSVVDAGRGVGGLVFAGGTGGASTATGDALTAVEEFTSLARGLGETCTLLLSHSSFLRLSASPALVLSLALLSLLCRRKLTLAQLWLRI
jgi:hypothetical protein